MDGKKISAALESGGESKGRRELNCREVSRDEELSRLFVPTSEELCDH